MENEVVEPDFIRKRVDVKADTVNSFDQVLKQISAGISESVSGKGSVVLVTNFGLVKGVIQNNQTPTDNSSEPDTTRIFLRSLIKGTFDLRNNLIQKDVEEFGNDSLTFVNNSSAIILENVEITPFANPQSKVKMGDFILFTDQIVGITLSGE